MAHCYFKLADYVNNFPDLGTGIEEGVGISYAISEHLLSKKVSFLSKSCEKIFVFSTGAKFNLINDHYSLLSWNLSSGTLLYANNQVIDLFDILAHAGLISCIISMFSGTLQHLLPQPAFTGSKSKVDTGEYAKSISS